MFHDVLAVKAALLHKFPQQRILVVGDVMLDKYLWGSTTRISPEAPVPVVKLARRSVSLGGAANVAHNLATLKVGVELAGFVGPDADAELLRQECRAKGIGVEAITVSQSFSTISKTRVLADDRQMLRLDEEVTEPRSEADQDALLRSIRNLLQAGTFQAVILSDYAKGVCTPYFCAALIALCRAQGVPVYVDPKGRDYHKYTGATAIKPNRAEMAEIAQALGWEWRGAVDAARRLMELLDLEFVAVTLGAHGMAVVQAHTTHEMPTVAREVYDVSGAGDTVIASMVGALASGLPLLDSAALANVAAAEVVARIGSTPVGLEDLLVAVQAQNRVVGFRKLYSLDELMTVVLAWRHRGLKVALTNGCFDLLHAGHVRLLEDAAAQSDRLIVAVNSDDSIMRLKGEGRPLMPVDQRISVLSALECVDAVVVYDEDDPLKVLTSVQPDILIKGGDYTVDTVVGADVVRAYGGDVVLLPLVKDVGTTRIARAISRL